MILADLLNFGSYLKLQVSRAYNDFDVEICPIVPLFGVVPDPIVSFLLQYRAQVPSFTNVVSSSSVTVHRDRSSRHDSKIQNGFTLSCFIFFGS